MHDAMKSDVKVHFEDIETAICGYIREADKVLVCSAWFTSNRIINALFDLDVEMVLGYHSKLDRGKSDYDDKLFRSIHEACGENRPMIWPPSGEIMHHKFIVFIRYEYDEYASINRKIDSKRKSLVKYESTYEENPYAVWTGSYNFTNAARSNRENGVYVVSDIVANEYYRQFRGLQDILRIKT